MTHDDCIEAASVITIVKISDNMHATMHVTCTLPCLSHACYHVNDHELSQDSLEISSMLIKLIFSSIFYFIEKNDGAEC